MNPWVRLESNMLNAMEDMHKRLLDMVGNSPDFKPKVYMHPLLKKELLFGDSVELNGKEIPIETDSGIVMGEIYIMDKTLTDAIQ